MLQAELVVVGGKQAGARIPLSKKFLVGREEDCHLRPNSELVSRHHCVFTVDDYTLRMRDLGSTNGTFVNGTRTTGQVILNDGDEVRIGKLTFTVSLKEMAQVQSSVAAPADAVVAAAPAVEEAIPETAVAGEDAGQATMTEIPVLPAVAAAQAQTPAQVPMMPQMPGYMPGYPGYPMQYQMPYGMPGYPMPGYMPGYAMPGYPQGPTPGDTMVDFRPPETPDTAGAGTAIFGGDTTLLPPNKGGGKQPQRTVELPTRLPDPEMTGAKAPAPPPAPVPAPAAEGQPAAPAPPMDPRKTAADIIKQYMQRRPPGT